MNHLVDRIVAAGDDEIEVAPGQVVQPGEGKDHAEILMKIEEKKRTLKLGERLAFTISEFNEIAFACHHLEQQLVSKLPKSSAKEGKGPS